MWGDHKIGSKSDLCFIRMKQYTTTIESQFCRKKNCWTIQWMKMYMNEWVSVNIFLLKNTFFFCWNKIIVLSSRQQRMTHRWSTWIFFFFIVKCKSYDLIFMHDVYTVYDLGSASIFQNPSQFYYYFRFINVIVFFLLL